MKLTRKEFIQLAVASAGAAALGACGDDTSGTGGGGTGGEGTGGSGSTTSSTTSSTTTTTTSTTTTTGAGGEGGGTASLTCSSNIGTNHGHSFDLSAAEVAAGAADSNDRQYNIQGTSQHPHTITLTQADFMTLAGGGSVQKTSSMDGAPEPNGHSHSVTVTCVA